MSVHENAVVLRFVDRATAYRALSELKHLASATTEVLGAVLVERLDDGTVRAPERIGDQAGNTKMLGGMAGSMAGMAGGPVGMLVATGIGTAIGGGYDHRRAAKASCAVELFSEQVGRNGTAIFAEVKESDTEALNLLAMEYDAVLERRPAEYLRRELKELEEAADRARRDEVRAKRDQKLAAVAGKFDTRVMTLRQKLAA